MTGVRFLTDSKGLCGFEISGHATDSCEDLEGKIVCAAVSSAAYMAVNTITEIVGDNADVKVTDAKMYLLVKDASGATRTVLQGFKLHLEQLSDQYGNNIKIFGGVNRVKD